MTIRLRRFLAIAGAAAIGILVTSPYTRESTTSYSHGLLEVHSTSLPVAHGHFRSNRTAVYFLKTHKCASTSVQRLFMIYAITRNLSVALPQNMGMHFFPKSFRPEIAKRTCLHPHFDVMAAHTRFDTSARTFMPRDTFFVSIVRDPAEQMESAYYYFLVDFCKNVRFARLPFENYMKKLIRGSPKRRLPPIRYPCRVEDLRFMQLYDLGLDIDPIPTRAIVQRKIEELDSNFHLVLIKERLDESLIIMRDMLGWSTEDLLYLKSNFRPHATSNLPDETRAAAYAYNWGDKMLYDHFRSKMDAVIERRKDYFQTEVRKFYNMQAAFYNNCVTDVAGYVENRLDDLEARKSIVLTSYVLSDQGRANDRCYLAAMAEPELFTLLNELYPNCIKAAAESSIQ